MKSAHEMTIDEVMDFAITQNHPILYQAFCAFREGHYTWEKAMQVAAVSACVSLDTISKQLVEQMMRAPISRAQHLREVAREDVDTTGLCTVRELAEKLTMEWNGLGFYPEGEMVFNHNGRKYIVEMKVIEAEILPAVYNTPRVIQ